MASTNETETFQHYQVLRRPDGTLHELGRGAMGVTYKAFDTNLRSYVALKVINALHLDSETARARFLREARAAAALRHRNIASVYHLGNDDQSFFYAMEFVDGLTLEAMVKTQGTAIPTRDALQIALQVSRALGAAGKQGLVHRDIKPANIMVEHEDDDEDGFVVKVIDFGLARSAAGGEGSAHITMGGFVGTPQFASPEQLEEKDLDSRSDIYSLGITLWYMLAGRPPFVGPLGSVFIQQLTKDPPWEQVASQPERVRSLLARVLQKDPAQRPQSPAELRREIESCLRALPSTTSSNVSPAVPLGVAPAGETNARTETTSGLTDGTPPTTSATASSISKPTFPASPPPGESSARPGAFTTGTVLAERYELGEFIGQGNNGRVFCARDLARDQHTFALKVLHSDVLGTEGERSRLVETIARLHAAPHSHLTWVESLEEIPGCRFLVQEWVSGFTLVDVLRSRGQLPVRETLQLLAQTAAAADHAFRHELNQLELGLHQILVHFPSGAAGQPTGQALLGTPVDQWPDDFSLKLDALGITREAGDSVTWGGDMTMMPSAPMLGRDTQTSIRGLVEGSQFFALGMLTYELLNGAPPPPGRAEDGRGIKYAVLPSLNEEANDVLRRMLTPNPGYGSATEFFHALCKASGVVIPLASSTTISLTVARRVTPTIETSYPALTTTEQSHDGETMVLHDVPHDASTVGQRIVDEPASTHFTTVSTARAPDDVAEAIREENSSLASETIAPPADKEKIVARTEPNPLEEPALAGQLTSDEPDGSNLRDELMLSAEANLVVPVAAPIPDEAAAVMQPVEAKADIFPAVEPSDIPAAIIPPAEVRNVEAKQDIHSPVELPETPAAVVLVTEAKADTVLPREITDPLAAAPLEPVEAKQELPTPPQKPAATPAIENPPKDVEKVAGPSALSAASDTSTRRPKTASEIQQELNDSAGSLHLDHAHISQDQPATTEPPSRSGEAFHKLTESESDLEQVEAGTASASAKAVALSSASLHEAEPPLPVISRSNEVSRPQQPEHERSRGWLRPAIAGVAALALLGTVSALVLPHHPAPAPTPSQPSRSINYPPAEQQKPQTVTTSVPEAVQQPTSASPPVVDAIAAAPVANNTPAPVAPEATPVAAIIMPPTPPPVQSAVSSPPAAPDTPTRRNRDLVATRDLEAEKREAAQKAIAAKRDSEKREADMEAMAEKLDADRRAAEKRETEQKAPREVVHKESRPDPTPKPKVVAKAPPPKKTAVKSVSTPDPNVNQSGPGIGFMR